MGLEPGLFQGVQLLHVWLAGLYLRREKLLHYLLFLTWFLAKAVIKKATGENREDTEAQRMLSNDPKEGAFEAAPLEDGEEDPPKEKEGGGTTSTAEATFSSTTSTFSTSPPQAMSTTKEKKGTEKKEDVLYVEDNTPIEVLMQPAALTVEFKPSAGACGSRQAAAGEARSSPTTRSLDEKTEEREGKKPRIED